MKEGNAHEDICKLLDNNYHGYVLITCGHPKKDGTMDVEMSNSDAVLAEYLLGSALSYFDPEVEKSSIS